MLKDHEAVRDVAVVGKPDKKWGEAITAFIVLHGEYEPGDDLAQKIIDFTRDRIAGYKRPKYIQFIQNELFIYNSQLCYLSL